MRSSRLFRVSLLLENGSILMIWECFSIVSNVILSNYCCRRHTMHGNMVFSRDYIFPTPQQSGCLFVCSVYGCQIIPHPWQIICHAWQMFLVLSARGKYFAIRSKYCSTCGKCFFIIDAWQIVYHTWQMCLALCNFMYEWQIVCEVWQMF